MTALRWAAVLGLFAAAPASAEVVSTRHGGFASVNSATVAHERAAVWEELIRPENWWPHTWSNDPANLSLEARAGGCLCEDIPVEGSWRAGSAEHARVVMILPEQTLRLVGALGPLQAEGVTGALTVTLADTGDGGTRIAWEYVVGGATRADLAGMAPAVDLVQAEFLRALVAWLDQAPDGV